MSRSLAALLIILVVAALIAVLVLARRDPRYVPSPFHRVADPAAMVLLALVAVATAFFVLTAGT